MVGLASGAAWALVEIGEPAIEPLVAAPSDENSFVCEAAVGALVGISEPAIESLVEALGDEDSRIRGAASEVLGKIGEPAIKPLIEALRDEDCQVRLSTANALVRINKVRNIGSLVEILKDAYDIKMDLRDLDTSCQRCNGDGKIHVQSVQVLSNDYVREDGLVTINPIYNTHYSDRVCPVCHGQKKISFNKLLTEANA